VRVKWLRKALESLAAEADFVAEESPVAASHLVEAIFEATDRVGEFPDMGRPGRVPGTRELVITGTSYVVPYQVRGGSVEILRVFHAARKWPTFLTHRS
jgi:toxin ParE1/3/4